MYLKTGSGKLIPFSCDFRVYLQIFESPIEELIFNLCNLICKCFTVQNQKYSYFAYFMGYLEYKCYLALMNAHLAPMYSDSFLCHGLLFVSAVTTYFKNNPLMQP